MLLEETIPFGILLKQLRKQAAMTQGDLAAALNCSDTQISKLEKAQRQPDLEAVITHFIPALGLQDDPATAAHLIERAAAARGERPPTSVTLQRTTRLVLQEELEESREGLPSPPSALIGRTEEVNRLCNRLMGHNGRLLTLVGPPGIGKTRLALAVAARLQHHFADGALFVPLAEISDAVVMASTITAALGPGDASPKPPKIKLIESLRRKRMLLVLDNCEQIGDAAPLVAEVLSSCAGVVVLATSRERLHLRAEQRHPVAPLELAHAVELFSQRAAAVNPKFEVTEVNRPTIEAICQRLDRLPLALELCAAQTDLLSLPQLLAHLRDRSLDLLVEGAHDLPARQRTLRHAIHSSYTLLSEKERTLFRTLGVFAGGFALQEFLVLSKWNRASGGDLNDPSMSLSTLHALVGKSMVRAETLPTGEQRFVLLEMIREFALECLRAQGEEAEMRQGHYATYLQLFRSGDSHLRGAEVTPWLARLQAEQDNLRAALQWALAAARYEDAAWLVVAVHYFWYLSGHRYEGARWLAHLLPYRHGLDVDLRLATLISFYTCTYELDEFQPVERYTDEVMQLLEVCSNQLLQRTALYFVAQSAVDISQAIDALERALALARGISESPERSGEFGAMTENGFGLAGILQLYAAKLMEQGEWTRAAAYSREGLELSRTQGNWYGIADCLGNLGRLALLQGDLVQARSLLIEVMTHATSLNDRVTQYKWQPLLGIITLYSGDAIGARRLLSESLRLCLEMKNSFFLAWVSLYLAETALYEGELEQAEQWLAQSFGYRSAAQASTLYQIDRLLVAARLAAAQAQYRRSAQLFGLAEELRSHIRYELVGPVRSLVGTALATVRGILGAEPFNEAFASGHHLTLDEAYASILPPSAITNQLIFPVSN